MWRLTGYKCADPSHSLPHIFTHLVTMNSFSCPESSRTCCTHAWPGSPGKMEGC